VSGSRSRYLAPSAFEVGFYRFAQRVVEAFNARYWSVSVRYEAPMPARPFILAPTHRSNIDTVLVGSITREPMTYMAKSGVFVNPLVGRFLRLLGGFPVDREATDREAVELATEALRAGAGLVVFPEGTRRRGPRVAEIEEGASYLALKAGVPIVPAGIAGSDEAMPIGSARLRRVPIAIVVGVPIWPSVVREEPGGSRVRRSEIRALTTILEGELDRLLAVARRDREAR